MRLFLESECESVSAEMRYTTDNTCLIHAFVFVIYLHWINAGHAELVSQVSWTRKTRLDWLAVNDSATPGDEASAAW